MSWYFICEDLLKFYLCYLSPHIHLLCFSFLPMFITLYLHFNEIFWVSGYPCYFSHNLPEHLNVISIFWGNLWNLILSFYSLRSTYQASLTLRLIAHSFFSYMTIVFHLASCLNHLLPWVSTIISGNKYFKSFTNMWIYYNFIDFYHFFASG